VSALAGPYRHPFHPLLVTVPIGAWTASLVSDLASHVAAGPGFLGQGPKPCSGRAAAWSSTT
jgi:uncharacterized membrane protein